MSCFFRNRGKGMMASNRRWREWTTTWCSDKTIL